MKLRDNKWGYDLKEDNPFRIFRVLREIADENVGESNVVDLSRGDPGYGYSPSVHGREFYGFLLEIDQLFNNPGEHFVSDNRDDFDALWEKIQKHAKETYSEKKAERLIEDFYFFLTRIEKYAKEQGLDWDKKKIVFEIFKYSVVSGGSYLDPQGETLVRLAVAHHYNKKLDLGIDYKDLVFMQGVSHGIGTIFKVLNDPEVGFLKEGDGVLLGSPVYAPYNTIIENRGLKSFSIPINASTGKVDGDLDEILASAPDNIKLICLIDPNNPTGFMNDEEFLKKIAAFAEERNALIVSDEVYSDFFFERKVNIMHYARKRTIMIGGRSKIERSTGLRFGEYIIPKEAQKYIAEDILGGKLDIASDLMQLLVFAKAPGAIRGEFQHVTFVAGPSQYLGLAHMVFGDEDRDEYLRRIRVNMETFYEILGLPYNKNLYYSCFDLKDIPGCTRADEEPEEMFYGLAKKGVVLIPSNLFFSESEREKADYRTFARGSLPNLTFSNLQKAAKLIKEYITS
ncbi:pyridoxal phosphate-dependent aminotransferase [Candidatus Peregrinibacteria bacterium]|jgi:aspartate/methionine/tyrosine aminotransferase|nr:pyridoxal phosphate-dependent aminotransferase [Candidatus Peregrinibacteria bacterium]MBT7736775.1 pyridoxal phosphate-dependent aminotransferase [Candidatus Peregrinibacteria bacterium]